MNQLFSHLLIVIVPFLRKLTILKRFFHCALRFIQMCTIFKFAVFCKSFNIPENEAKRRIIRTESDRRAFIRKYFNAEIADPVNYDMVVNTGTVGVESAVTGIAAFVGAVT